ncbi:hypothetical protein GCM10009642_45050 [Nocardiopsis metallicus]
MGAHPAFAVGAVPALPEDAGGHDREPSDEGEFGPAVRTAGRWRTVVLLGVEAGASGRRSWRGPEWCVGDAFLTGEGACGTVLIWRGPAPAGSERGGWSRLGGGFGTPCGVGRAEEVDEATGGTADHDAEHAEADGREDRPRQRRRRELQGGGHVWKLPVG